MEFLQKIAGYAMVGVIGLCLVAGGISWFGMTADQRADVLHHIGRIIGWLAVVIVLPGATFFLIRYAAAFDSNTAGAILVIGYTLIEAVLLLWLNSWQITGTISWIFVIAGVLIAGLYNVLICDWIAEKLE